MENFKVLVLRTTYSTAEVSVMAENEEDARSKAFELAVETLDDDHYEVNNQEFDTEIGRSFSEQKVIFHYGGHDHVLSFVPNDEDYWESFTSEGMQFDVHYDESTMDICVYLLVRNDSGGWEQYVNAIHKQEIKHNPINNPKTKEANNEL